MLEDKVHNKVRSKRRVICYRTVYISSNKNDSLTRCPYRTLQVYRKSAVKIVLIKIGIHLNNVNL